MQKSLFHPGREPKVLAAQRRRRRVGGLALARRSGLGNGTSPEPLERLRDGAKPAPLSRLRRSDWFTDGAALATSATSKQSTPNEKYRTT